MYKISIIGAGMTGSTTANYLASRELADIVLIDIMGDMAKGKALDMLQSMSILNSNTKIIGSADFSDTKDSDIVVITAGIPRKPGMSREDLLSINAEIVGNSVKECLKYSKDAIFVILTNPLDAMAYLVKKISGLPSHRIIGQAGVLDSARMRAFIANETKVSVENISCFVLGGHGDEMLPLTHISNIAGVPLDEYLDKAKLDAIVERTRKGGGEIVSLLKNGSAFYAPAAAIAQMCEAILKDKNLILPCSAYLDGEYGLKDIFFGVPVMLNRSGIAKIIEYKLNPKEKVELRKSASAVEETIVALNNIIKK